MESSHTKTGETTTLEEYVNRMPKTQNEIFYLIVPSRNYAEQSPYFEAFRESGTEVLFMYDIRLDDFVMSNLGDFKGKKLKTIESSTAAGDSKVKQGEGLKREEFQEFSKWLKDVLTDKVTTITETDRLSSTPCIIVDHESATFRRMMKVVDPRNAPELPKQQLQVNTRHPIILRLNDARKNNPDLARDVAFQIFDNALIQAGLVDDGRAMVPRINKILERALGVETVENIEKIDTKPDPLKQSKDGFREL